MINDRIISSWLGLFFFVDELTLHHISSCCRVKQIIFYCWVRCA